MEPIKLSIVIPCFNESKRIGLLYAELDNFDKAWKKDLEIIIVDDGSTDGSVEHILANPIIQKLQAAGKFHLEPLGQNQGKGKALQRGVALATGTHILTMDADLSYSPSIVIDWIKQKGTLSKDEILLGSRLHKNSVNTWENPEANKNKGLRKIAGYIFSGITKVLTTIKVRDNQSGFKLYPADVAKFLFNKMTITGWAHDVELLYTADLNRVKITEMPVNCINREGSKINVVTDSLKMLFQILWLSLKLRCNYYLAEPFKILIGKYDYQQLPQFINAPTYKREGIYRFLFSIVIVFLFLFMPSISQNYGISGDEWIQNQYGKEVYNYFANGDSTAYTETKRQQNYDAIIYYSGGYELLLVTVAKWFPQVFEYDVRHFINSIVGCLLFLFTGLFAKRLAGWRVGFIALIFIAASPRIFGELFNNSKDIPFALGVIFSLYHMVPFLKNLPKPSWRSVILIALGVGFTLSVRFGGFLLIAYLGLFGLISYVLKVYKGEIKEFFNKDFSDLIFKGVIITVVAYAIGVATWPWAMQDPISNPMLSMEKMTNFPITVSVLFNGEMINSGMPPWNYTLLWIFKTSPEIVLLGFLLSLVLIFNLAKYFKTPFVYFLLFATIFPVAYAVYKGSGLYDGWRHFLFVYPTMVILGAMVYGYLLDKIKNNAAKFALGGALGIGVLLPVQKIVAYHPNQYVYFNHLSGGLKGNYKKFETDYYMHSARECFFTLAEKEQFKNLKDTIVLQTNMVKELTAYAATVSPYIKVDYSKFENRTEKDYHYGIYMSRFVDFELLKADGWPAKNAIVTISRDEVPLTFAIKKNHHGDYLGTQAMKGKNLEEAIQQFEAYLLTDPTNEAVLSKLGQCYSDQGNFPKAIETLTKAFAAYPNMQNRAMLGIAYAQGGNPTKALDLFSQGVKIEKAIYEESRAKYFANQEDQNAGRKMYMAGQALSAYYYYMSLIYGQLGDTNQAQSYRNLSSQFNPQQ